MNTRSFYTLIKFRKIINGILCILCSIPFIIGGTYIIFHQLTNSLLLLICIFGIIGCIITSIKSMLKYDKIISK